MLLLLSLACSEYGLNAMDELTLDAVNAEVEDFAKEGFSEPDAEDRPELFAPCDPQKVFEELQGGFDRDADGALDDGEQKDCMEGRPEGEEAPHRQERLHVLMFVYDVDADGELSEEERATLFEDFQVRCEALQAQVLEDYDADGDGELSEAELESARAAHEAEMEERRAEMEAQRAEHEAEREGAEGQGPGEQGGPGELGPPEGVPPFAEDYDLDGDGVLDEDELSAAREEARERLRAGERPF